MTRVCFIGNSHLVAMMYAWEEISHKYPDVAADFYSENAQSLVFARMEQDGRLHVSSDPFKCRFAAGGRAEQDSIDFSGYDAVIIVGLLFGPKAVLQAYKRYSFMGLNRQGGQVMSKEQFKRATLNFASETAALHIANLLKGRRNLFLVPCALPGAKGFLDANKASMEIWREAAEAGDGEALMGIYTTMCNELTASGITVVPQPSETKASAISTLQSYNSNVLKNKTGAMRPENDYSHMNSDYGAVMWGELLAAMEKAKVSAGQ